MNGMEAWSIVAPILAAHGGTNPGGLDCIDEAYVTVYGALKHLDERKEKGNVPKENIAQATNKIIKCSLGKWYVGRTDGAPDEVVLLDDVLRIIEDLLNGKEKD